MTALVVGVMPDLVPRPHCFVEGRQNLCEVVETSCPFPEDCQWRLRAEAENADVRRHIVDRVPGVMEGGRPQRG